MLRYDVVLIIICNVLIGEASVLFDTKPNRKMGRNVAEWTEESNVNPEELGNYLEGDIITDEIGRSVADWQEDWNVNPEELGNYLEGDIMLSTDPNRNNMRGNRLWKRGIVPYVISGRYNSTGMDIIHWAFNQYKTKTCVWFRPKRRTDVDYIDIVNGDGCSSYVGRKGGRQQLSLRYPGCMGPKKRGTVLHELMHAIGIQHEQSRTDRDQYIEIIEENIDPDMLRNFAKNPRSTFNDLIPYDYRSVMHYSKVAFGIDKKGTLQTIKLRVTDKLTATVPDSLGMGQRVMFTPNDLALINQMYCRMTPEMMAGGPNEEDSYLRQQ